MQCVAENRPLIQKLAQSVFEQLSQSGQRINLLSVTSLHFTKKYYAAIVGISLGKISIAKVEGGIITLPQSSGDEAMNTSPCILSAGLYKGHRFPARSSAHCVWLYFRFCLSCRDVEGMMVEGALRSVTRMPASGVWNLVAPTPS